MHLSCNKAARAWVEYSIHALAALLHDKLTVFAEQLAIHADLAALAQVADHIPVEGRLVDAERLGNAGAQGKVNSPTHLLIEKRIFRTAINIVIIAKSKFAQAARPLVHTQHPVQVVLAPGGTSLDHHAILKTQAHIFDGATGK